VHSCVCGLVELRKVRRGTRRREGGSLGVDGFVCSRAGPAVGLAADDRRLSRISLREIFEGGKLVVDNAGRVCLECRHEKEA
jgi:hypothetical protein